MPERVSPPVVAGTGLSLPPPPPAGTEGGHDTAPHSACESCSPIWSEPPEEEEEVNVGFNNNSEIYIPSLGVACHSKLTADDLSPAAPLQSHPLSVKERQKE